MATDDRLPAAAEDADDDEDDSSGAGPRPPGGKFYMTPEGHAALKAELDHLWKIRRPEVVKVVEWAASLGDRSENADYKEGKRLLRQIDKRVRFLAQAAGQCAGSGPGASAQPAQGLLWGDRHLHEQP